MSSGSGEDGSQLHHRRRIALGLLLAVLLDFQVARAASPEPLLSRPDESWRPALGFLLAVDSQAGDAFATSSARGDIDGDGVALTPLVGLEFELLSPTFTNRLGRMRLFVRTGMSRAFDVERSLVKEGSPGTIDIPLIDPDGDGVPDQRTPIAATRGRGTRFQTEVQPWGVMVAAGLAIELPGSSTRSRTVRIKPSIEYRRERFQATAFLGDAQSLDASELCPCRTINFGLGTKQTLHAIGPGLEVEMDSNRVGPMIVTIYGAFRAYRAIDGRSLDFDGGSRFDDGTPVSLEGRLTRDPWSYRFGVGLRLRWNPS